MKATLILFVTLLVIHLSHEVRFGKNQKRVLLKNIKSLTLDSKKKTEGRRSKVPQLKCVSGKNTTSCSDLKPRLVECHNIGVLDNDNIQWNCICSKSCHASFGKVCQFVNIQVSCEGYDNPEDPYILSGSCGLSYSLNCTKNKTSDHDEKSSTEVSIYSIIGLIVFCISICACYKVCTCCSNQGNNYTNFDNEKPTGSTKKNPNETYFNEKLNQPNMVSGIGGTVKR